MPPAPDPKVLDILRTIKSALLLIQGGNDYYTTLEQNVFIGKDSNFDDEQRPGLNIFRSLNPLASEAAFTPASIHTRLLEVSVDCIPAVAGDAFENTEKLIADVWKALGVDITLGGLAETIQVGDDNVIVVKGDNPLERKLEGGIVNFKVLYRTDKFQPR